jgi:hypothetical protein
MNINWKLIKKKYLKSYEKFIGKVVKGLIKICYCDIEKFFDDNEIYIEIIYYNPYIIKKDKMFFYRINFKNYFIRSSSDYKTRDKVKENAIIKVFEILEKKLENIK